MPFRDDKRKVREKMTTGNDGSERERAKINVKISDTSMLPRSMLRHGEGSMHASGR